MSSTIGTGLQAGHAEPSRVHADRHLRDGAETAMGEFSWMDRSAIAIERVDAIAVYQNEDGNIVIRQQNFDDEDDVIIIPCSRVNDLITAIKTEAGA